MNSCFWRNFDIPGEAWGNDVGAERGTDQRCQNPDFACRHVSVGAAKRGTENVPLHLRIIVLFVVGYVLAIWIA